MKPPDAASPLANDDYLILPTAFGVVTCLDAKTGKVLWEHEFNQGFRSSPVLAHDRVYIIDLSGVMHVFKMGDRFEVTRRISYWRTGLRHLCLCWKQNLYTRCRSPVLY